MSPNYPQKCWHVWWPIILTAQRCLQQVCRNQSICPPKVCVCERPIILSAEGMCRRVWSANGMCRRVWDQSFCLPMVCTGECLRLIILSANGVCRGMFETHHFVCQWCVQGNVWDQSFCLPMVCAGVFETNNFVCQRWVQACEVTVRQELYWLMCMGCQTGARLTSVSGVSDRS